MENKLNILVKALTNFIFYWAFVCFILLLLYDFTVYGQLQQLNSRLIYSSSRNDLPDYNNIFEVKSTDDASLLIMSKNNKNQYKSIRALLPNGPTIDIELNFLDKNITHIFPLTMKYYLLLYGQKINSNMQVSGIVLDYDKQIIKDNLSVANGTIDEIEYLDLYLVMDTRLSSFLIYYVNHTKKSISTLDYI